MTGSQLLMGVLGLAVKHVCGELQWSERADGCMVCDETGNYLVFHHITLFPGEHMICILTVFIE